MRLPGSRARVVLILVLPVLAFAAYRVGQHFWGAYHCRAAQAALEARDFPSAGIHLQKSLEIWPRDLSIRLLAAQTARRQGDHDTAREHLRSYHQNRGSIEILELEHKLLPMQEGDLRQGNALLALCTEHPEAPETPQILEAYIEGTVKVLKTLPEIGLELPLGDDAKIWPALDQWLQQRPSLADQAQGLVWRGQIHALTGAYRRGVADLRAALELDPNHFEARWLLAKTIIQEAPGEAAAHLEALRRRRPDDARVQFTLAEIRRSLGQLDEAGRLLDAALAAAPNDVPALLERARVALDAQQAADAEPWLRRAEALAPEHPDVHLTLSRCLHLAGRLEEAERYQARFQQLDTDRKKKQDDLVRKIKSARHS